MLKDVNKIKSNVVPFMVSPKNLLLIGLIIGKSYIAIFDLEKSVIVSKNNPKVVITKSNKDLKNGSYMLEIKKCNIKNVLACCSPNFRVTKLWHHMSRHLNFHRLHFITTQHLVTNALKRPLINDICEECIVKKHYCESHKVA